MKKKISFIKMHGLGNDFVIIDNRKINLKLSKAVAKEIADRNFGIGCDQLVLIEKSRKADCFMRIYNADGGEVSSCGNASRCVADIIMKEKKSKACSIETQAGKITCNKSAGGISVDMGVPKIKWDEIPLAKKINTINLKIKAGALKNPVAVSMGNPHMVFFVNNGLEKINLATLGPPLEHHPLFPERANVEVAEVTSRNSITLRVWERGSGETLACGTGACAALIAASRKGFCGKKAKIKLKGGILDIEWLENNHVVMTGAVEKVFSGVIEL